MSTTSRHAPTVYGTDSTKPSSDSKFHYVYRITNTVTKKHYYGKRSSKHQPFSDLGTSYFSSSTILVDGVKFKTHQKLNPQDYIYKVVAVLSSAKQALIYEMKIHSRLNVATHQSFHNKINSSDKGPEFQTDSRKWMTLNDKSQRVDQLDVQTYLDAGWMFGRGSTQLTKGKRHINNGIEYTSVDPDQLEGYLNAGWKLGIIRNTKDYVWVYKDQITKRVPVEDVNDHLKDGWVKGRLVTPKGSNGKSTMIVWDDFGRKRIDINELDSYLERGWWIGAKKEKKVCINKNGKHIYVSRSIVNTYLDDGWLLGKIPPGESLGIKIMNKDGTNKRVPVDQVDVYLEQGWELGTLGVKSSLGTKMMNKDATNKRVPVDQVEEYLGDGWVLGEVKRRKGA